MRLGVVSLLGFACSRTPVDEPQKPPPAAPRVDDKHGADLAKLGAAKLAYEAFPQWAATHPDKVCPGSIDELTALVDAKHRLDPWGHPYVMLCGATLPQGVNGLGVLSVGPDGKQGTTDDINSWTR